MKSHRERSGSYRIWLILAGVIAGILLLPRILAILVQVLIIVLVLTAIALLALGCFRLAGSKIDLSGIAGKLNSILGRTET